MEAKRRYLVKKAVPALSRIHGYGLFAKCDLAPGEVVDETPLLILGKRTPGGMIGHCWNLPDGRRAVPLGDGMLCNSGSIPNVREVFDLRRRLVTLVATREIKQGHELTLAFALERDGGP